MKAVQKKEWAKMLFTKEHISQKEIAEQVGVTPQTVNRWVKNEGWDKLRVSISITKEEQLKALYRQLDEINNEIANRPERRYATTAEGDIIAKISAAIEKMETEVGLSDIISVLSNFVSWLRGIDLEKAKELAPLLDEFIKSRI